MNVMVCEAQAPTEQKQGFRGIGITAGQSNALNETTCVLEDA